MSIDIYFKILELPVGLSVCNKVSCLRYISLDRRSLGVRLRETFFKHWTIDTLKRQCFFFSFFRGSLYAFMIFFLQLSDLSETGASLFFKLKACLLHLFHFKCTSASTYHVKYTHAKYGLIEEYLFRSSLFFLFSGSFLYRWKSLKRM